MTEAGVTAGPAVPGATVPEAGAASETGVVLEAGVVAEGGAARPDRASPPPLRDFYENPDVPLSSGPDRAHRMAGMLTEVLRDVPAPAVIDEAADEAR